MKVTALRVQRRNRRRVDVYLDGERAFSLTTLLAAGLHVDQDLSTEEVASLQARDAREDAHEAALRYLGYRPRSEAEVRRYLEQRGLPPEVQEETLSRLRQSGLVSDDKFVRFWVENRERFRPRSRRALRYELRLKGIAPDLIEGALASVDEEDGAYTVVRKKAERFAQEGLDARAFRQKLGQFLARRGYGYDVIRQVVSRLWQEFQEDPPVEDVGEYSH